MVHMVNFTTIFKVIFFLIPDLHLLLPRSIEEALDRGNGACPGGVEDVSSSRCSSLACDSRHVHGIIAILVFSTGSTGEHLSPFEHYSDRPIIQGIPSIIFR